MSPKLELKMQLWLNLATQRPMGCQTCFIDVVHTNHQAPSIILALLVYLKKINCFIINFRQPESTYKIVLHVSTDFSKKYTSSL